MRPNLCTLLSTTLVSIAASIAGVGEAGASAQDIARAVQVAACSALGGVCSANRAPPTEPDTADVAMANDDDSGQGGGFESTTEAPGTGDADGSDTGDTGGTGSDDLGGSPGSAIPRGGSSDGRTGSSSAAERRTGGVGTATPRSAGTSQPVAKRTTLTAKATSDGEQGRIGEAFPGSTGRDGTFDRNGHGKGCAANARHRNATARQHGPNEQSWGANMRARARHVRTAMARQVAILRFKYCLAIHHGRDRAACGRYVRGLRRGR